MNFFEVLDQVVALLRTRERVTYRALKLEFHLDDEQLETLKEELIEAQELAVDKEGKMLVWTGGKAKEEAEKRKSGEAGKANAEVGSSQSPVSSPELPVPSSGERRQLTVLFCDLVGSTALSAQLDPEDLREVVRAYQATAAEVITRFEGHIAQYLGDGLLVYFGYPRAHEDDARRAVQAGLEIIEALRSLNARLELDKRVRLAVRLGIHTGLVVVGEIGDSSRHEQLALGETPNVAARLQGLAAPDTVVISAVTARLVQSVFALEELGIQQLKGVIEPLAVARVLGLLETKSAEEDTTPPGAPFLVGRDEEVGLLRRRWEQSKEGLGQVMLMTGEAGIGKTALVDTLRAEVRRERATRITFHCSPYHRNSVLYPVIEHLQRVFKVERDEPPAARLEKLERVLATYHSPLAEVVPLFAALLSVPVPEGRYPSLGLTPQQQKQQTHDALMGWLVEESERQAVLAVWEDVQWADPSTLEVLGLVVDQTPTVRMLTVLTFRPDFLPPWPTRSHMTPLTLNRLERPQVEALVSHLAGGKALPAEVLQQIVGKTDGVPLFVEELTKMVLESNMLRPDNGHYELTGPLQSLAIPVTLQDSLMARLDRLSEVAGGGATGGCARARVCLRDPQDADDERRRHLAGAVVAVGSGRVALPAGAATARTLLLQACVDPGCGVCVDAEEYAPARAPADRAVICGALSGDSGDRTRSRGSSLHRGRTHLTGHSLLAEGRTESHPALGRHRSDRPSHEGAGVTQAATRHARAGAAGARLTDSAWPGLGRHEGQRRAGSGTSLRPGARAVSATR